jgi:hypothetical protein
VAQLYSQAQGGTQSADWTENTATNSFSSVASITCLPNNCLVTDESCIVPLFQLLDVMSQYNEDLHNLNSWPCIIRMIKSRKVRSAGHVARTGEIRIFVGETEDMRLLGRLKT